MNDPHFDEDDEDLDYGMYNNQRVDGDLLLNVGRINPQLQAGLRQRNKMSEIELLAPTEGDEGERDNFEKSYFEVMPKAKLLCMQDESKVESERFEVESNVTGSSNRSRSNQCGSSMVKLPTINLPVFDNKQQDWH
nr:unnamed protein product [Callosobruchus analis]